MADERESKRRKVRKGTQSCWECKRRKVRCIFATTSDTTCENCMRRRTTCTSQEYPDHPMASNVSNHVDDRLGRVEQLIEHLVNRADTSHSANTTAKPTVGDKRSPFEQSAPAERAHNGYVGNITPAPSEVEAYAASFTGSSPIVSVPSIKSKSAPGNYEELNRGLIAAWPSQHDVEAICKLPVGLSAHLHSGICTPHSSSVPSPQDLLQLPPPDSHPVLIARKLLVLGTFLQGVPSSSLQLAYRDLMFNVIETAIRLVTTNDELITSVEGIECIMIEANYHNYAGHLHRAWMAVRRAITIAQMMALHRGLNSPSLKILDPETRATFDPDHVRFRLVNMDYYLSLMLGLPLTSLKAPEIPSDCRPLDRMQRTHCMVAKRILQRDGNSVKEFHEIDTLLQKAAAEMPAQWWLIPRLSDGPDVNQETMRLMDQFTQYHLLTRLHLPYMLQSSPEHSKMTVVNASREILLRFIAFRTYNPAQYYCRGTDFLAFIATTALCLAHIDSRSSHEGAPNLNSITSLTHSRSSDRGIMECTLEIIEDMDADAIALKIARILRPLLAIEGNAAGGTSYSIVPSKSHAEGLECHGKSTDGGKTVHVYIPHFGTILFERGATSNPLDQGLPATSGASTLTSDHNRELMSVPSHHMDEQSEPHNVQTFGELEHSNPMCSVSNLGVNSQVGELPFAGIEDDWDLQGIDVALFDSLFSGTTVDEPLWAQWPSNG